MHLKTLVLKVDWLSEISDMTVSNAIEYLSTLDQDKTLECFLEGGDDHGVEIRSWLYYTVPMCEEEIMVERILHLEKVLKRHQEYQANIRRYGNSDKVSELQLKIDKFQAELDALKGDNEQT